MATVVILLIIVAIFAAYYKATEKGEIELPETDWQHPAWERRKKDLCVWADKLFKMNKPENYHTVAKMLPFLRFKDMMIQKDALAFMNERATQAETIFDGCFSVAVIELLEPGELARDWEPWIKNGTVGQAIAKLYRVEFELMSMGWEKTKPTPLDARLS